MKRSAGRDRDAAFGQAMSALRDRLGWTQESLADYLGVSRRSVVDWEAGGSSPKAQHLKQLIALGIRERAFPPGREEAEIRTLWRAARQKALIDEDWLAAQLAQKPVPAARPDAQAIQRSAVVNLPFQPTPFFGRSAELNEIARILADPACRLLTLLGPGGIGKTRLALEYAASRIGAYADGVVFVSLASVGEPNQIASAIGDALKLSFSGQADPVAYLLASLKNRQMLLMLDNFEHLLDGADLVYEMLMRAPGLTLLVTSRERLNLRMEWLFNVEGLAYPAEDQAGDVSGYSAVQLFAQRAAQVQPGMALVGSTLTTAARICQQVAGMPLAIELAAAGARMMPIAEIERQIRSNLDVLATSLRDMPPRHRSMRAVFDHSWNLLSEPERALLSRLSVFRGGCTADAAGKIAGATLSALTTLIDKSLLRQAGAQTPEARFALLEPIREYALGKLQARGEAETMQRAHAAYYLALAESVAAQWDNPTGETTIEQLDYEFDNLRAALQWARDGGDLAVGFELGWALRKFWQRRGYYREGRAWLEALLAHDDADGSAAALRARLRGMHTAAWLASDQHDYARATELFEKSRALSRELGETGSEMTSLLAPEARQARAEGEYQRATALFEGALAQYRALGDRRSVSAGGLGNALYELALVLRELGEFARSAALFEECLNLHRELGDREGMTVGLMGLGDVARDQADVTGTRRYNEPSLAIARELGLQWAVGFSLNNLAVAALVEGNVPLASALSSESVTLFRSIHAEGGLAEMLITFGHILRLQGNLAGAREALAEALRLASDVGPRLMLPAALEGLASVMAQSEQAAPATRLLAAAARLRAQMGTPMRPVDQPAVERAKAIAQAMLGVEAFDIVWGETDDASTEALIEAQARPSPRAD